MGRLTLSLSLSLSLCLFFVIALLVATTTYLSKILNVDGRQTKVPGFESLDLNWFLHEVENRDSHTCGIPTKAINNRKCSSSEFRNLWREQGGPPEVQNRFADVAILSRLDVNGAVCPLPALTLFIRRHMGKDNRIAPEPCASIEQGSPPSAFSSLISEWILSSTKIGSIY